MDYGDELDKIFTENLRDGREYMRLDDLIRSYPDGVKITGWDQQIGKDGEPFNVYTFLEDNGKWFSGGGELVTLGKKFEDIVAGKGGDMSDFNEYLRAHPQHYKISKVRTRTGKTYTKVSRVRA